MNDPFGLARFVEAQEEVLETVERELMAGRKRTHWMWFVFPQHRALGMSGMARRYGIGSLQEAKAYLAHPVLGERLRKLTDIVLGVQGRRIEEIFGSPDDAKFRSCMTLFGAAAPQEALFRKALARYFDGGADQRTLALLAEEGGC